MAVGVRYDATRESREMARSDCIGATALSLSLLLYLTYHHYPNHTVTPPPIIPPIDSSSSEPLEQQQQPASTAPTITTERRQLLSAAAPSRKQRDLVFGVVAFDPRVGCGSLAPRTARRAPLGELPSTHTDRDDRARALHGIGKAASRRRAPHARCATLESSHTRATAIVPAALRTTARIARRRLCVRRQRCL